MFCTMKKYLRPTLLALLVILLSAQFYRPERNQSDEQKHAMSAQYPMPASVESTFKAACYDCHSNYTQYPWYAEIQPVRWWLDGHIKNGKSHLNFSTFSEQDLADQHHQMDEITEVLEKSEMPLRSYTWIHSAAQLSEAQVSELLTWTRTQMATIGQPALLEGR